MRDSERSAMSAERQNPEHWIPAGQDPRDAGPRRMLATGGERLPSDAAAELVGMPAAPGALPLPSHGVSRVAPSRIGVRRG
jgi:hypothetical protein